MSRAKVQTARNWTVAVFKNSGIRKIFAGNHDDDDAVTVAALLETRSSSLAAKLC